MRQRRQRPRSRREPRFRVAGTTQRPGSERHIGPYACGWDAGDHPSDRSRRPASRSASLPPPAHLQSHELPSRQPLPGSLAVDAVRQEVPGVAASRGEMPGDWRSIIAAPPHASSDAAPTSVRSDEGQRSGRRQVQPGLFPLACSLRRRRRDGSRRQECAGSASDSPARAVFRRGRGTSCLPPGAWHPAPSQCRARAQQAGAGCSECEPTAET